MKKTILVCVTCISIVVVYAQDNKSSVAPPPPPQAPTAMVEAPPPPPIPDAPPPPPPAPPKPPVKTTRDISSTVIINDHGNEISIMDVKGTDVIFIKKEGKKTQRIKLSTWNANRKFYEKQYGQLPPPPPPIPAPEVEEQ